MFMRQKRNKTALLIWTAPHGPYPLGSNSGTAIDTCWASWLSDHANQRCEIQWEALEFSEEHKWLE